MSNFIIAPGQTDSRLDVVLASKLGFSRDFWQEQIKNSRVLVNGKATKPSWRVRIGDLVDVHERPGEAQPLAPDLPVIYEDQYLMVVDKPAGLLVHNVSSKTTEPTVAQFAAGHSSDADPNRSGIVHRLDRDTSGLLIIAKDEATKDFLQNQFRTHKVEKTYTLLADGHLKTAEALIDLPIGRKPNSARRAVMPSGKSAQTSYKVTAEYDKYCLVEAKPKTGRTHQLRVHFAHLGHPIAGDGLYGHKPPTGLNRMFLHASAIKFAGPDGRLHDIKTDLPAELKSFLARL